MARPTSRQATSATGTKTGAVTATNGHPFWVPALHQWVEAGNLTAGQWLQTSSGTRVQITAIRHHTKQTPVYNLTVDDLHTYYVGTGQGDLVHNAQPGCGPHLALGLRSIHGGQQGLLDEFARSVAAITYTDAMFNVPIGGVMTEPMVRDMIDVVVSRSGRMTFNMHGITRVDEMLTGGESYVATRGHGDGAALHLRERGCPGHHDLRERRRAMLSDSRSPESAWTRLLQEFRPPHSGSDLYTPAMWTLLQAAHRHPLLSTLYPELSTTMLTFSRTDDFQMRGGERFPVIGAAAGEFGVSAYPVAENNILLVTSEVNKAVALAASLIEEQLDQ